MKKTTNNAVEKAKKAQTGNGDPVNELRKNKKAREKARVSKTKRDSVKAHAKEEKEKKRLAKAREKARELAQKKEQKRDEKLIREQRKQDKQNLKYQLKKQREQEKNAHKKRKQEHRQKNKEQGRNIGGWLSAVISLAVVSVLLTGALTYTLLTPTPNDMGVEYGYQRAFYDTVEQVDNIDVNLSKILATKDGATIQKYLLDTAVEAELAESDIQVLPLKDESKFFTAKLINQIGDYSKYLHAKLSDGQNLSAEDVDGLQALYRLNRSFKEKLARIVSEMGEDYSFSGMENAADDLVLNGFNEMGNLSTEFPELIYDGPFSDGLTDKEVKGLSGDEISVQTAKNEFTKIFNRYDIGEVESVGETFSGIECFNLQTQMNGETLYAQISKKGGKLIMFDYAGDCPKTNISDDEAINVAEEFLEEIGLNDMREVWINKDQNVYTVNFAYEQNGIIVYPDLVKVRVCATSGNVYGLEATSYYANHCERDIVSPVLTKAQAKERVSDTLFVREGRLCVVPIGEKTEKTCYEFVGVKDGETYYAYIDAVNGRQVEMFKVIGSGEGELLI